MNEIGWKQLKQLRQENRLILLHKGLNGYANIPISDINQNKRKQRKGLSEIYSKRSDLISSAKVEVGSLALVDFCRIFGSTCSWFQSFNIMMKKVVVGLLC
jgi:hypothetical protein